MIFSLDDDFRDFDGVFDDSEIHGYGRTQKSRCRNVI